MSKFFAALALLATSTFFQQAQAKPSPYSLETPKQDVILLRNTSSRRMVWMSKAYFIRANWSADRRAVVVEIDDGLLVWREGFRLLRLNTPLMPSFIGSGHWDYTMGCLWSPDKKRFLVRAGGSGDDVLDAGDLFCCKLGRSGTARYIRAQSELVVRKMKWRDNRTVLYWTVKYENKKEHLIPHVWRVP